MNGLLDLQYVIGTIATIPIIKEYHMNLLYKESKLVNYLKEFREIDIANKHLQHSFKVDASPTILGRESTWLYNYRDNILGDKEIENEAGGLILDDNCNIICAAFPKITKIGNLNNPNLFWMGTKASILYDGMQIIIYSHKGEYFIRTKYDIDGGTELPNGMTVRETVLDLLSDIEPDDPFRPFKEANKKEDRYCWFFELISPETSKIIRQEESELILFASIDKIHNREIASHAVDKFAKRSGLSRVPQGPAVNIDNVNKLLIRLGSTARGIVATDVSCNRILFESPIYKMLKKTIRTKQNYPSARSFAELVLNTEVEDLTVTYEHYTDILYLMQDTLTDILEELDDLWSFNNELISRKEFAEAVKHHPLSKILFLVWDGKAETAEDMLPHISSKYLADETKDRYTSRFNAAYAAATDTTDDDDVAEKEEMVWQRL